MCAATQTHEVMDSDGETSSLRKKMRIQTEEDELESDTTCGFGPIKGPMLQKLATKNFYIFFFGVLGLFNSASWAYYNGTINTMEKRFKIPSKALGFMNVATNASQLFMSAFLGYWAGRSHRPRWVGFSQVMAIIQMILYLLPHVIYGAGEEALRLTQEYGTNESASEQDIAKSGELCGAGGKCMEIKGSYIQPGILFLARFVGGIGGSLFYTAGVAYIDDNVSKTESPFLLSLSFFIRMLGPSLGYAVAAFCLKFYVAPSLTPQITDEDPRWIGAWWTGWIFFIIVITIFTVPLSLFPKTLPKTSAKGKTVVQPHPSITDLCLTAKRLMRNRTYLYNTLASVMYILGESPYFMFLAKYIEVQYRQKASVANFWTGATSLATSALGILISGIVISRLRPSARSLAGWNVLVAIIGACASICYMFINCSGQFEERLNTTLACNVDCNCENTPYSPVCSNGENFISPCHAGCTDYLFINGTKEYTGCSCSISKIASSGQCPSDCSGALTAFLIVLCISELAGASGVASNFLLGMRCVDEKDKSAAMGLTLTLLGLFGFAPAPVLYGYILDSACVVWGKTCDGTGNCWLYDGEDLAYVLNLTAAVFIFLGVVFDTGVWYHAKDIKMFDE